MYNREGEQMEKEEYKKISEVIYIIDRSRSMYGKEEEITESTLLNSIRELYQNRQSYIDAMSESSHMNSIEKITGLIEDCVNK